jgi:hypothetical protein
MVGELDGSALTAHIESTYRFHLRLQGTFLRLSCLHIQHSLEDISYYLPT